MNAQAEQTAPLKSRAQAVRDMVEIRIAVDASGPAIARVLKENGIELSGADWSRVFPHWLIATVDEHVIGCCQVIIGKPVGYVEFMLVRPEVPFKLRAIALRKLILSSIGQLNHFGCQYVGGVVATKNLKFANVIEKLNFVKTYPADLYVKRLR